MKPFIKDVHSVAYGSLCVNGNDVHTGNHGGVVEGLKIVSDKVIAPFQVLENTWALPLLQRVLIE